MNETQIFNERQISKETQIENAPQILKESQIFEKHKQQMNPKF